MPPNTEVLSPSAVRPGDLVFSSLLSNPERCWGRVLSVKQSAHGVHISTPYFETLHAIGTPVLCRRTRH